MKFSHQLFSLICLSLGLFFLTTTLSSCKKDQCKNLVCFNGGQCANGVCNCLTLYEGKNCESSVLTKFVRGAAWGADDIQSNTLHVKYSTTISKAMDLFPENTVMISSLLNQTFKYPIYAYVNGSMIFIPIQAPDNDKPLTVTGTGTIYNGVITWNYDLIETNFYPANNKYFTGIWK